MKLRWNLISVCEVNVSLYLIILPHEKSPRKQNKIHFITRFSTARVMASNDKEKDAAIKIESTSRWRGGQCLYLSLI